MRMTLSIQRALSAAQVSRWKQHPTSSLCVRRLIPWVALPLIVANFHCSTYFNTFYNAEMSFGEGYKIHKRAMENFPDSILIEPPADARAKYDRAIEKAAKVLEVFPKDKKWHDDAVYLLGKSYFYEREITKAVRRFRELQQEYPQSPFVPESYLYLAKTYIVDDNLTKAEEALKFALDRYPFLDKDQKITLLLVEIEIRREGKSQAIGRLERVRSSVHNPKQQTDLLLRVAELQMGLGQYDKAITLLKRAPRSKKDPQQEYRIDHDLVSCYIAMDSLETALRVLKGMRENRRYVSYFKEILYADGCILERRGKIDEAIDVFRQIVGANAADTAAVKLDTSRTVSKAWYALGQLYQKKKGNYKEAQKYYKLVSERPVQDTPSTPQATARLAAMKKLQELRSALPLLRDSLAKRNVSLYKIGEIFYFELDEPDSAYRSFFALANDSTADTTFAPKALCAAAGIARKDLRDTLRSDSVYSLVVARYPGTDYACKAQTEMRSAVIAKTRKQQSDEAFREAEKMYLGENDPKAAVQAYFEVYKKYSDCDVAPKSLYAAAWITDNDLQKKKTAKTLYEKICERYPHSVYCEGEAQPRIKVVLDTLEALRQQSKKPGQPASSDKTAANAKTGNQPVPEGVKSDSLLLPSVPHSPPAADSLSRPSSSAPGEVLKKSPGSDSSGTAVSPTPIQTAPGNPIAPSPHRRMPHNVGN
jgi:TolA-binding protein